jgi:energy-coupling factor transporter ATP-binding protein EcfA2
MDLIIENVRTFSGRCVVPLKPLTLLTGENSSGKTTFLAILAALCNRETFPLWPNFNRPPYDLGNYDTIATYKGGKFGRAKHFAFGYHQAASSKDALTRVEAKYVGHRGHAQLQSLKAKGEGGLSLKVDIEPLVGDFSGSYEIRIADKEASGHFNVPKGVGEKLPLFALLVGPGTAKDDKKDDTQRRVLYSVLDHLWHLAPAESISIAPIRTRPERNYSQITESFKPTGDHIPFLLEQILRDDPTSKQRHRLIESLRKFGEDSGLFRHCTIKHLGKKASDPFQLMVNIAGHARNLVDVGYGVSQALPVIVQSVLVESYQLLLLQQPEVHLHPRAQAALGTFFARLAGQRQQPIVIETHSDYMIDRIRTEVAAGTIDSEAVTILYFHRDGLETVVHSIGIDKQGNLTNVPSYYREFFLQEELNLFTRADH